MVVDTPANTDLASLREPEDMCIIADGLLERIPEFNDPLIKEEDVVSSKL